MKDRIEAHFVLDTMNPAGWVLRTDHPFMKGGPHGNIRLAIGMDSMRRHLERAMKMRVR